MVKEYSLPDVEEVDVGCVVSKRRCHILQGTSFCVALSWTLRRTYFLFKDNLEWPTRLPDLPRWFFWSEYIKYFVYTNDSKKKTKTMFVMLSPGKCLTKLTKTTDFDFLMYSPEWHSHVSLTLKSYLPTFLIVLNKLTLVATGIRPYSNVFRRRWICLLGKSVKN